MIKKFTSDSSVADKQRRMRRFIFYSLMGTAGVVLALFLFVSLRSLFLPLVFGALLAYLFRPLKNFLRVSWMPDSLRIFLLFSALLVSIIWASAGLRSLIPNEQGKIELKVRLKYKFNEKFEDIMGITKQDPDGHAMYGLIKGEISPPLTHLNDLLSLSPKETSLFLENIRKEKTPSIYLEYYRDNRLRSSQKSEVSHSLNSHASEALAGTDSRVPANETSYEQIHAKRQGDAVGGLLKVLSTWFVMPLVFIFLLFDDGQILRFFLRLIPNRYFEVSMTVVNEFDEAVGRYLRGTLIECSLVGGTLALGLFLIGVSFPVAVLIGSIAGITNAIPFLGPFIGLVVGLTYALIAENVTPLLPFLTESDLFLGVVVCVALTQLLDNVVFQPVVLGSAVQLHPIVVVIAVVGGSILFGFAGMLLAIPFVVIVKTVIETLFKELKSYQII